jgi:hypothetical protein
VSNLYCDISTIFKSETKGKIYLADEKPCASGPRLILKDKEEHLSDAFA